jgi:ribosomal protein L1
MDKLLPAQEARILVIAQIAAEAEALGEAALAADWEEARFRSIRLNNLGFEFGSQRVAQVARDVTRSLGPAGTVPSPGYGAKMGLLSAVIGRLLD